MRTGKRNSQIEHRRELVADLRLRQMTVREIADELAQAGFEVSKSTIGNDLQAVEQRWRESSIASMEEHKARQLAEIQIVKRRAWVDGNLSAVLKALELEVKLLGTDAPIRVDWRSEAAQLGMDPGQLFDMVIGNVAAISTGD